MMMRNSFCAIVNLVEDNKELMPLTKNRPVASLPFGGRYRLIDFPFTALHDAEATSAALFISGSGHSLYDHIRSGGAWGLDSTIGGGVFTHSQIDLKETAAEEGQDLTYYQDQRNYVKKSGAEYVVIMGSKMLCNVNLQSVLRFHQENLADVTVVYKNIPVSEIRLDSDIKTFTIDTDTDTVISTGSIAEGIDEDAEKVAIQTGIVMLSVEKFLSYVDSLEERGDRHQTGIIAPVALEKGDKVCAYEYTGYLKYIDSIHSYFQASMDMLDEDNFNALFYRNQNVITRTKNGAPTYYSPTSRVSNVQIATDCFVEGQVENSILFRKVRIKEEVYINHAVIMQGSMVGEGAHLEYVILDKNVTVDPGVRLVGTPDEPIVVEKGTALHVEKGD